MKIPSLRHLSDGVVDRELSAVVARENVHVAVVIAHIAEFDARRLYLRKGFPSMYRYCTDVLNFSEDQAYKRIRAARASRRFPGVLEALAEGRVHLSAISLLARHLTADNVDELLAAATHRTKADVELLIARRFPRPDLPTRVTPLALPSPQPAFDIPVNAPVDGLDLSTQLAPGPVAETPAPAISATRMAAPAPPSRVHPVAEDRFGVQFTMSRQTHDKLRRAQELLGFAVGPGDIAQVLDRALDALIAELEKRRCGRTSAPRRSRPSHDPRHVPAAVKRVVWARDHDQCTFVSDDGHRCPEKSGLELDHVLPAARGGESTPSNLRLRCRAHNQYEAERAFGTGLMERRRAQGRVQRAG